MVRALCIAAGLFSLAAFARPDVDAITFAKAFQAGHADQFKMKQISGTGVSFHGNITERLADGSTRRSLVVTLGAVSVDAPGESLQTWDEFVEAERARRTLVIALSGPDLPEMPARPATIRFSGVYDGQLRTIMRVPQAADSTVPDSGPCPGEQAPPGSRGSFYCAPLLTGVTATIVPR
jgi:hypothetical protein